MNLIETQGLTRAFGRAEAVRGLDLAVPAGSVTALLGANGAGKSTTIRLLMNLLVPTAGHARVLGVDSRRLGPADPGRLRTLVTAHRHGSGGETLSLISEDLPRAAWPAPNAPGGVALPIDPRAAELLEVARPSASVVRHHDVEIAFDGALADRDRLGSAIEVAAWWAGEVSGTGPYR